MKHFIFGFLFLSSLYGLSQTAYYVSNSGSDLNSGLTEELAFSQINTAIDVAVCGDSIYVLEGIYNEKVNAYHFCNENNRIVVQGDLNSRPQIIGDAAVENKYAIGATGSGFRFRHFDLTSPTPEVCDPSSMVIVGRGDYYDFIDVHVHHAGYDGIKTTSDCTENDVAIGWRIIDSKVFFNGLNCPTSIVNGDGIDLTGCKDCVIENTTINDNKGHQIQVKLGAKNVRIERCHIEGVNMLQIGLPGNVAPCDPAAINADSVMIRYNTLLAKGDTSGFVFKMANVRNVFIENNTIVKDSIALFDVGFICLGGCGSNDNWQFAPQAPNRIKNNLFYSKADVPFLAGPDTTLFDPFSSLGNTVEANYNLFFDDFNMYSSPPDGGPNSIVADPMFCNYPSTFHLDANSPCIDAGDPESNQDPDGSSNDIGAVYYQSFCESIQVQDLKNSESSLFYPNPFEDQLNIHLDKAFKSCKLFIYNSQGKLLLTKMISQENTVLDMTGFMSGIFFYSILDADLSELSSGKIIKSQ